MADTPDTNPESEIPPARFDVLVQILSSQSLLALGLIPDPQGNTEVRLPIARHFIDMLAMLETKTKSNLTGHEHNLLERTLHELRVLYLDKMQAPEPPPA